MYQILSDADVVRDLVTSRHEEMYVNQKSESTNVRHVAKLLLVNRKMNYLSHIIEKGLGGSFTSTLFEFGEGHEQIDA